MPQTGTCIREVNTCSWPCTRRPAFCACNRLVNGLLYCTVFIRYGSDIRADGTERSLVTCGTIRERILVVWYSCLTSGWCAGGAPLGTPLLYCRRYVLDDACSRCGIGIDLCISVSDLSRVSCRCFIPFRVELTSKVFIRGGTLNSAAAALTRCVVLPCNDDASPSHFILILVSWDVGTAYPTVDLVVGA
jgi:hypothetical protein